MFNQLKVKGLFCFVLFRFVLFFGKGKQCDEWKRKCFPSEFLTWMHTTIKKKEDPHSLLIDIVL